MYTITGLKIHNICQHEDVSVRLECGLTAITGRNGVGKSNLIRALMYGLTGQVDGIWGSQSDLQKYGELDPGYVEVHLANSQDGSEYSVRRYAACGGRSVSNFADVLERTAPGDTERIAVRRQAVDRKLEEMFCISLPLLFQLCWGRQGKLDYLLTSPASSINSFLQSVFDMRSVEKLREKIKAAIDTIADYPESIAETRAETAAKLEAIGADPDDIENRQLPGLRAQLADARGRLDALKIRLAGLISEQDKGARMTAAANEVEDLKRAVTAAHATEVKPAAVSFADACAQELAELTSLRNAETAKERSARALQDIRRSGAELDALEANVNSKVTQMHARIDRGGCTCEFCGATVTDQARYASAVCRVLTGIGTIEEFDRRAGAKLDEIAVKRADNASAEQAAQADAAAAETAEKTAEARLSVIRKLKQAAADYEKAKQAADRSRELLASLKAAEDRLAQIGAMETASKEDQDQLAALSAQVAGLEAGIEEATALLSSTVSSRKLLGEQLETLDDMISAKRINDNARNLLASVRDLLSPTRAQATFLRSRIDALNSRTAHYMLMTQMPFSLYLNKDTHLFEVMTTDGFIHPPERLSGAQKSMSSVILQMAVMSTICPMLNLFMFDEPAEALDAGNKVVMAELFSRMATMLPSIHGSMLLITRDQQLIDSCSRTIVLGEDK